MNISIIGSGSWGIALSCLLHDNNHNVTLYSPLIEEVSSLQSSRVSEKLSNIIIPDSIFITDNLESALSNAKIIILATPSIYIREMSKKISSLIKDNQLIICVAKGFEIDTLKTLSDVIKEELPNNDIAILSGPSHAEEVAIKIPTTVLVASTKASIVDLAQNTFMNDYFRVYGSNDILGVEIGGAIKNVIALAAGIIDGLGFGDNSKAALMTRGLAEIKRLGVAMGAHSNTFHGLSGIGDLIVTCTSMNSRNRRAGILIGKGYTLEEAQKKINMVVEGVYATQAGYKLSQKYNVEMPITTKMYDVLVNGADPKEAVLELMTREKKFED